MTNLLLSIVFSTLLFVILRLFPRMKVITFNGIVVNYFVAATWSFVVSGKALREAIPESTLLPVILITGSLFIVVFYITGLTTQRTGVAVAAVASKMSMVIPVAAGLLLYKEELGLLKAVGILLAFPAVYLVSKPTSAPELKRFRMRDLGLPILLFFGAGIVDTLIKAVQHFYITPENKDIVIMCIFGAAGIIGFIRVCWLTTRNHKFFTWYDLAGGIALGSCNYLSLLYLIRCLELPGVQSSAVFTVVNTGIVVASALIAALFFKEHFTRPRIIGTLLALASIVVLSR
jgi:drug/metabolite transporter (DMT)-like permease